MDATDLSPITASANAVEYVATKFKSPPRMSGLPPDKQKKFEEMLKQDFFKDDPYRCMWDKDWITKSDSEGKCK